MRIENGSRSFPRIRHIDRVVTLRFHVETSVYVNSNCEAVRGAWYELNCEETTGVKSFSLDCQSLNNHPVRNQRSGLASFEARKKEVIFWRNFM